MSDHKTNNKKNPFKLPENYFDDFHKEMMARIQEDSKKPKVVPLWRKATTWSAIAAVLIGVVFFISIFTNGGNFISGDTKDNNSQINNFYASSDEEYFYLFLEDQAVEDYYEEVIYTNE